MPNHAKRRLASDWSYPITLDANCALNFGSPEAPPPAEHQRRDAAFAPLLLKPGRRDAEQRPELVCVEELLSGSDLSCVCGARTGRELRTLSECGRELLGRQREHAEAWHRD